MICPSCMRANMLPKASVIRGNKVITLWECPRCGYTLQVEQEIPGVSYGEVRV